MRSFSRWPIFLSSIGFSLSYAVTLYIHSTYLTSFFSPLWVSVLYIFGALGNIFLLLHSPELIKRLGHKRLLFIFFSIIFASIAGLVAANDVLTLALSFFLYSAVSLMVYYLLDIYLENSSTNARTGRIRGLYLTLVNAAIAAAPLLSAFMVKGDEFHRAYVLSFLLLIPVVIISMLLKKTLPNPTHIHSLPFAAWRRAKNVRRITTARFILEFFFALMVIFTPIYLHRDLGFNWSEIGVMFSIMLLPFVIFEWPVGIIADRWWGEKEIMTFGFFATGISLILMPFMGKIFIAWTCLLFLSRVGASFIEITTESYFFKHIDSRDAGMISIFRLTRPVALILGSVIGGLVISYLPLQIIFFILAIAVFLGMKESIHIKDTL